MVYSLRVFVEQPANGEKLLPRLFMPGDRVTGKVVLTLTEDENIDNIFIDFKGKCRTKIVTGSGQNRNAHRYERVFFHKQQTLFKGPFKMRADTYEYPFAFQFPDKFNYTNGEFTDQNWAWTYSTNGPKPLPPTCLGPDLSSGGCEIYYHLTARVPRSFADWEHKQVLNFSPPRTVPDPAPLPKKASEYNGSTYHRHYRLTDEGTCRTLTTRESMKETFRHNAATSTVNFTLNATAPTTIVIGRTYNIDLMLTSPDEATGNIMPPFTLKTWLLILKTRTAIRVPGVFSDYQKLLEDHISISSGTLNSPTPLNKMRRIANLFPKDKIYAPPTFECMAIKRNYDLELKLNVECLGETSEFKIKWRNVMLFAAKMEDGVEEAIKAIESGTAQLGIEPQGALPPYDGGSASVEPQVEEQLPSYGHAVKGSAS
ncbi:hypothetical protein N431DRAFT_400868 [Stipitochalara longipes BDJ]|nr:hypothetical protein N431DRAFT_400868 [Stipitochalara longipes BDJ]